MESDTFCENFMVKLALRLSGNLIYNVFSIKTPDIIAKSAILGKSNEKLLPISQKIGITEKQIAV